MRRVLILILCSFFAACSGTGIDYSQFRTHMPKSILVIPALNNTAEVRATDVYQSTVSSALGEAGFYVFPVALVDMMLKENGVPTPGDMRQVSLGKLREVFGADAVLYVTINQWGTRYLVIGSSTNVSLTYELVDLRSGTSLWQFTQSVTDQPNHNNQNGLAGLIAAATVHALVNNATDAERPLAIQANNAAFHGRGHRLLRGAYHPKHQEDMNPPQ